MPPHQPRVLVGIELTPYHNPSTELPTYALKIKQHAVRLHTCRLPPMIVLQEHQAFW